MRERQEEGRRRGWVGVGVFGFSLGCFLRMLGILERWAEILPSPIPLGFFTGRCHDESLIQPRHPPSELLTFPSPSTPCDSHHSSVADYYYHSIKMNQFPWKLQKKFFAIAGKQTK